MKENRALDSPIQIEILKKMEFQEKLQLLELSPLFIKEMADNGNLAILYKEAAREEKIVIASIIIIGEARQVFHGVDFLELNRDKIHSLIQKLLIVEEHYQEIGGIIGYHNTFLHLLHEANQSKISKDEPSQKFLKPATISFFCQNDNNHQWVRWGIEALPQMAEIYPVGGAGDRLGLRDSDSGEGLPVAALPFAGRTLLEHLIRDLQAKEYLYYKLIGDQLITPIVMMTSEEKNNQYHIKSILKNALWFGRGEESFFFFIQPLVPVITVDGHWAMADLLKVHLKPGGHGSLWKLAKSSGAFLWLKNQGRKKGIIRQINNPIAGTDFGILAFCGIGVQSQKLFGFSSCPRLLNTAEGTLVLVCKNENDRFEYKISNIEYTDFKKNGLKDLPENEGDIYSRYPTNTNLLFADLDAVEEIAALRPFSGMIANCKNDFSCVDEHGAKKNIKAGRLESTMQSLSESITTVSDHPFSEEEHLASKVYVTYGERKKTISVTKNALQAGKSPLETPQAAFYEMLQNHHELLFKHCGFSLPKFCSLEEFLGKGPNFLFLFHPALGPLYSVISQKVRQGIFQENAELQLEITELEIEDLNIDGSLLILSKNPLGSFENDRLKYGEHCGKCELKNVKVENKGIDRTKDNMYWKNEIERKESLKIILEGNAEFFAENLTFSGEMTISVPAGMRYTAVKKGSDIIFEKEKISNATWFWNYSFGENDEIILKK